MMIPYFLVEFYHEGKIVRTEVCMNILEAEQKASDYKDYVMYDEIRIKNPGEHDNE